jgi:hypothetical protein
VRRVKMYRKMVLCFCVIVFSSVMATAQEVNKGQDKAAVQDVSKGKDKAAAQEVNKGQDKAAVQDVSKGKDKATSQEVNKDKDKELSGMSIVGNDEAPKSLYIVPWKSSELGAETSLNPMLTEGDVPVDRDVFKRQLEFYHVSRSQ